MQERFFVKQMRRLTNSRNGNPRYRLVVANKYGETQTLHTKTDAGWVYTVTHGWEDRMIQGTTHKTSRNIILDAAELSETF